MIVVPGGKPVIVAKKSTLAAVMLFDESLVVFMVIVTVPLPLVSGPTAAGVSLDGKSVAVKTNLFAGPVGWTGLSLLQPMASRLIATARVGKRDISFSPLL